MKITNERWRLAQEAEKRHWKKWKLSMSKERKTAIKEYWNYYLRLIKTYLKTRDKILDIGCGPDGMINYIDKGERYGLDPLMDFYLSNFEMQKDIEWRKGTGESLPFENDYFNVVISTNTLDHVCSPERMLEEINRVLKMGGFLILTVNCCGPLTQMKRKIKERLSRGDPYHPYSFSSRDVRNLLTNSKFDVRVSISGIGTVDKYARKKG